MNEINLWNRARKVLINKYAITLYVFALLFLFVGEQSLLNQISRKREIRKAEREIVRVQAETEEASNLLESLDNKDSLERFAREQYKMHKDNEDVYLVE
jgi:cell division protein FtsB